MGELGGEVDRGGGQQHKLLQGLVVVLFAHQRQVVHVLRGGGRREGKRVLEKFGT